MGFEGGTWLNEPASWRMAGSRLHVVTDEATDFWRETHYGFVRGSGHFFGCPVPPSFTAQLLVRARYDALYDQAGIMVWADERHWVKAGIERSDGACMLSSVLTNERSDWAAAAYGHDPAAISGIPTPRTAASALAVWTT